MNSTKPICPSCGSECYLDHNDNRATAAACIYRCTKCAFIGYPNWIWDVTTYEQGGASK